MVIITVKGGSKNIEEIKKGGEKRNMASLRENGEEFTKTEEITTIKNRENKVIQLNINHILKSVHQDN